MTISKLPFVLCALAIGTPCFTVRADDNPAQAAARMALANQQVGLNAQPATNAPAPAARPAPPVNNKKAKAEKPVATPKPKPAAQAPAVAARPAPQPAPAVGDNSAQVAARNALAKQSFEQNAQQTTNPAPSVNSKEARAAAQAPVVVARPVPEPAPVGGDNSAQAAARMALGQQPGMTTTPSPVVNNTGITAPESTPGAKPAPATPNPTPVPPALLYTPTSPNNNNYVGQNLGFKPIMAPALPINTSKQARLQALLERYQADQITPEEYHKQRAAILAEP